MIPLFVEGTMNVLKHHGIIEGPMGRTGKDSNIFSAIAMPSSRPMAGLSSCWLN